jgi:hypothetical protein
LKQHGCTWTGWLLIVCFASGAKPASGRLQTRKNGGCLERSLIPLPLLHCCCVTRHQCRGWLCCSGARLGTQAASIIIIISPCRLMSPPSGLHQAMAAAQHRQAMNTPWLPDRRAGLILKHKTTSCRGAGESCLLLQRHGEREMHDTQHSSSEQLLQPEMAGRSSTCCKQ